MASSQRDHVGGRGHGSGTPCFAAAPSVLCPTAWGRCQGRHRIGGRSGMSAPGVWQVACGREGEGQCVAAGLLDPGAPPATEQGVANFSGRRSVCRRRGEALRARGRGDRIGPLVRVSIPIANPARYGYGHHPQDRDAHPAGHAAWPSRPRPQAVLLGQSSNRVDDWCRPRARIDTRRCRTGRHVRRLGLAGRCAATTPSLKTTPDKRCLEARARQRLRRRVGCALSLVRRGRGRWR